MAEVKSTLRVEFTGQLTLSEPEMRALHHMSKYSHKDLAEHIEKFVAKSEFNKAGFISLMSSVGSQIGITLNEVDGIRRDVYEAEKRREEVRRKAQEDARNAA